MSARSIAVLIGTVWPTVSVVIGWRIGRRLRDVRRSETRAAE